MTASAAATRAETAIPRPEMRWPGRLAVGLLAFLARGSMGGGAALMLSPDGSSMQWDVSMLDGSPFSDFLIPGFVLFALFGAGSVVAAVLGLRHVPLAPFLAFAIGCGLMIWIVVELAIIKELSFLHPLMFATGLGIAAASVRWGWPTFQGWRAYRS